MRSNVQSAIDPWFSSNHQCIVSSWVRHQRTVYKDDNRISHKALLISVENLPGCASRRIFPTSIDQSRITLVEVGTIQQTRPSSQAVRNAPFACDSVVKRTTYELGTPETLAVTCDL